ncbi:MAG: hypothetical protein ACUVQ8_06880 [Nitrososphaeria archaeon]
MNLEFRKEERFAEFRSPLKNYEIDRQIVEHRYDPLTRRSTVITTGRLGLIKRLFESDDHEISEIVERTRSGCPFCPEQLQRSTPGFPSNIVEEGRIQVGEAILFPSLFAHMDYNAIAVLSREHYLELKQLAPKKVFDAFKAGLIYLKKLHKVCGKVLYASYIENYFPLSGSTIVHPHMQIVASDLPFGLLGELLEKSKGYYSSTGTNFWEDFVNSEANRSRFLGWIKDVVWLTPFAPTSTYEVWALSSEHSSFFDVGEEVVEGFAEGVAKVLNFYQDEKLSCFNLILYSGPLGSRSDKYFRLGLRIMGRSGYKFPYVSDLWGLQSLMFEGESYDAPEDLAQKLRRYF